MSVIDCQTCTCPCKNTRASDIEPHPKNHKSTHLRLSGSADCIVMTEAPLRAARSDGVGPCVGTAHGEKAMVDDARHARPVNWKEHPQ